MALCQEPICGWCLFILVNECLHALVSNKRCLEYLQCLKTEKTIRWADDLGLLLQLRNPQWSGTAEVQEERAFLFGQEGSGADIVNTGRQVLNLHITETASEDKEIRFRYIV